MDRAIDTNAGDSLIQAVQRSVEYIQRLNGKRQALERRGWEPCWIDYIVEQCDAGRRMAIGLGSGNQRPSAGMDGAMEESELHRQASGRVPNGIFVTLPFLRTLASSSPGFSALQEAATGVTPGTELQPNLYVQSAVMDSATVLTGLKGGEFDFFSEGTPINASGNWVSEVGTRTANEPAFGSITMTPKTIGFYVDISLVALSSRRLDVQRALEIVCTSRLLAEVDRSAYVGVGGNAPDGLFYNAGVQVVSAGLNGAAPAWDHLVELEYQVSTRVGGMGKPHFITSPYLRKKMRKTQKGAGLDYILSGDSGNVFGAPVRATPHSPDNLSKGTSSGVCSALLYGDMAQAIVGFFGPAAVDVTVDGVTRADRGMVRIHFRADVAVAVRNTGAFAVYKDLLAA